MKRIIAVAVFCIFWLTTILLSAFNKDLMRINNCVVIFIIAILLFIVSFMNIPKLNEVFTNAGMYLKMIAKVLFVLSTACLITILIVAFIVNIDIGILSIKLLIGEVVLLVSSLILYGYGEIVERNKK